MGYFANGSEGMSYEDAACSKCVHQKADGPGCVVWMLHILHGYDECNNPESYLHALIPRSKNGLGNELCKMYYAKKQPKPASTQEELF